MQTQQQPRAALVTIKYDRLQPFLQSMDPSPPLHVSTFATLAQQVCEGKPTWEKYWGNDPDLMDELEDRPEWCLDLTFMHALLRLGYELAADRQVEIGKQIEGTELGWCLGATLAMVGAELKCRV